MIAKFELSAYGVEEMNKQEMIEIDGGVIPGIVWLVVEVVGVVSSCIATYYTLKAFYDQDTGAIREITPEIKVFENMCADSVKIDSKGNMIIYNPKWH